MSNNIAMILPVPIKPPITMTKPKDGIYSCIPIPVPSYNALIEGYDETISKFSLNPTELRMWVANEHTRERADGSTVYYREMQLPIHLLKGVYVKKEATRDEVGRFFAELGLDVPVRMV